jgi:hypothetical protein
MQTKEYLAGIDVGSNDFSNYLRPCLSELDISVERFEFVNYEGRESIRMRIRGEGDLDGILNWALVEAQGRMNLIEGYPTRKFAMKLLGEDEGIFEEVRAKI